MERNLHEPEIYDFRQHDRLWQRVGPGLEPYPETTAEAMPRREELPPAQESQLPGAEPNPCCMGSEARELLAVLEGYIEEELEDRRRYLALSRQAPSWARQTLRDMAELLAKQRQEKEPLIHCGVYLDIAAADTEKLRTARDTVSAQLVRSRMGADPLLLRQREGFLSANLAGGSQLADFAERVLPARSVANLYPLSLIHI